MSKRHKQGVVRVERFERSLESMNQEMASKIAHALYEYHMDFVMPLFDAIEAPWWKRWWLRRKVKPVIEPIEFMTPEKLEAAYKEMQKEVADGEDGKGE
jgi:hypothetical protein